MQQVFQSAIPCVDAVQFFWLWFASAFDGACRRRTFSGRKKIFVEREIAVVCVVVARILLNGPPTNHRGPAVTITNPSYSRRHL
jgi:hypothetical protein